MFIDVRKFGNYDSDKSIAWRFSHAAQQQLSQLGHDRAKFQRSESKVQTLSKVGKGKALQELRRELCNAAVFDSGTDAAYVRTFGHRHRERPLVSRSAPLLSLDGLS